MTKYAYAKSIIHAVEEGKTIECAVFIKDKPKQWIISEYSPTFSLADLNNPDRIRIKPEPEYVPLEQQDIPPVCWVRSFLFKDDETLITKRNKECVACGEAIHSYNKLMHFFEYSSDCKNWSPCRKEKK